MSSYATVISGIADNLRTFKNKTYPGRVIAIGPHQSGNSVIQIYMIMGRSATSRNRVFEARGGKVLVGPVDPKNVQNAGLIIYNAMDEMEIQSGRYFVVSNGRQTDAIMTYLKSHQLSSYEALQKKTYEPDPSATPRISAVCCLDKEPAIEISILRKADWGEKVCERDFFCFNELVSGVGFCISTYEDDGDPLPSFQGRPFLVPLEGTMEDILNTFWDEKAQYFDNLVSIAVKEIDRVSGNSKIIVQNKFTEIPLLCDTCGMGMAHKGNGFYQCGNCSALKAI